MKYVWKTVLMAEQYKTKTTNRNLNLKHLGIPVTDTPTVTDQILYRALDIVVYDRMSLDCFARQQETTVTRNRTATIATHTEGEKMYEIL
jgi:hypothetical protein